MNENDTATSLKTARAALNRALPDEIRDIKIVKRPDGILHIEVALREHRQDEHQWARFAEAMHEESPLRGESEEINARGQAFRAGFSFKQDK